MARVPTANAILRKHPGQYPSWFAQHAAYLHREWEDKDMRAGSNQSAETKKRIRNIFLEYKAWEKAAKLREKTYQAERLAGEKNPRTVDARAVLKAGKSILARVKRVGNKLVIQPVERAVRRAATKRRNPRTAKPMAWYSAILHRPDAATNLAVKVEANTITKARAAIRREYPKLKIIGIKREAR